MSDTQPASNVPEFSVSELAFSLKKTLEDNFGHVRVRGELSRVSFPASGHMYSSIKDDQAVIDAVCWKGNVSKLSIKPEEGLEVICTGKISSYPKSSKYQLIIESMELAGEGALLKMLEDRRKKLAAEGLFDEARKKPIPFLPQKIGVVTSPTGAVIRDILHRLADRFPRHVQVWPVIVQGDGAAEQIASAIRGFSAMGDPPDLLIVARGGGSLEDLMAFNEEIVVRAAADCSIPVISAVGHETDTTLIDYAADLRAPTPTGAAEMAVPMRINLMAQILEDEKRLLNGMSRVLSDYRHRLETQVAKLGDPRQLLNVKIQNLDHASDKITRVYGQYLDRKKTHLIEQGAKLRHPKDRVNDALNTLNRWGEQLRSRAAHIIKEPQQKLQHAGKMLEAYSFENILERGFAVVHGPDGLITSADQTATGQAVKIQFKEDKKVEAVIGKGGKAIKKKPQSNTEQESLF